MAAEAPMNETQVKALIDEKVSALQERMSGDLRVEFANTVKTSEETSVAKVTDLQERMSTGLKAEFEVTNREFQKRLDFLGESIDAGISKKFEEADVRF